MFTTIKYFFLLLISLLPIQSEVNYNEIDLTDNVMIIHRHYDELESEVLQDTSYLSVIKSNDTSYNYIYKNKENLYLIDKDSIKVFNNQNYKIKSTFNFYHDFDKPLSSYIYFIENNKQLDKLVESIEDKWYDKKHFGTHIQEVQKIYLKEMNMYRTLKLTRASDSKSFFKVEKKAWIEDDTLNNMWEEVIFLPNTEIVTSDMLINHNVTNPPKKNESLSLDHKLKNITNETKTLDELFQGKDYLLIYNWTVWCGYCRMNSSSINKFYNKLDNSKYNLISINCDESYSLKQLEKYTDRLNYNFQTFTNCEVTEYFNAEQFPNLIMIDRNLKQVGKIGGYQLDYKNYYKIFKQ